MASARYKELFARTAAILPHSTDPYVQAHGRWIPDKPYPWDAYKAIADGATAAHFQPAFYFVGSESPLYRESYGDHLGETVSVGESQLYTALQSWENNFGTDVQDIIDSWDDEPIRDESGVVNDPAKDLTDAGKAAIGGSAAVVVALVVLYFIVLTR